jgi:hypothetical protein
MTRIPADNAPAAACQVDGPTAFHTVRGWTETHPWPSEAGLRHLIFHSRSNGFARAFRRVGRRVLIDEAEFYKAVRGQESQS